MYFFSHETREPPHVHVDRDSATAKFWIEPVGLAYNLGFKAHELRHIEQIISDNAGTIWRRGVSTSVPNAGERVVDVHFSDDTMSVDLVDGRTITVPLAWYPRLLHATAEARQNWRVSSAGFGIHWPDIDEDLSSEGLLRGAPAPPSSLPISRR
jgi:hypothetical protein